MPYLGRDLNAGNYLKLDDISSQFNGSTTTFNLTSGGEAFFPGSAFSILVSLGGVIQEPESAFQINLSQIIFAAPPQSSDDFFCIALGVALGVGVPADGTVSTEKLVDGSVTADKLAANVGGVGISSAGDSIGIGITQLNFVGTGNTFLYNAGTNTLDISISGGNAGAGGTWASSPVGVHTTKLVGINTTTVTGVASSEGALQTHGNIAITDGSLIIDQIVGQSINIPSGKNGLLIGPTTVAVGVTVDVAPGSTLVVV